MGEENKGTGRKVRVDTTEKEELIEVEVGVASPDMDMCVQVEPETLSESATLVPIHVDMDTTPVEGVVEAHMNTGNGRSYLGVGLKVAPQLTMTSKVKKIDCWLQSKLAQGVPCPMKTPHNDVNLKFESDNCDSKKQSALQEPEKTDMSAENLEVSFLPSRT